MFKNLLVPLDGSPFAEKALDTAKELAAKFNSQLLLLCVIQPPLISLHEVAATHVDLVAQIREMARQETIHYLHQVQESLLLEGCNVRVHIVESERVARTILETANKHQADTIIMSTHGRGGLSRWVYGSVADRVLQHSDLPVLLVRVREELLAAENESNSATSPEEESAELLERMVNEPPLDAIDHLQERDWSDFSR